MIKPSSSVSVINVQPPGHLVLKLFHFVFFRMFTKILNSSVIVGQCHTGHFVTKSTTATPFNVRNDEK